MAQVQDPTAVHQLANARSTNEQIAILRSLKNEVVGHVQKKEAWVALGILPPIVEIVAKGHEVSSAPWNDASFYAPESKTRVLSPEEQTRLHALQLVSSFAQGGPAFLPPLQASGAVPATLANLYPSRNHPQIVRAALSVLLNLAEAAKGAPAECQIDVVALAEIVFSPQHLESLTEIISPSTPSHLTEYAIRDVSSLVIKLCREKRHQFALADSDLLDALATNLASVAVALGYVAPGAKDWGTANNLASYIPDPAPSGANLGVLLDAIAAILGDSQYATYKFLHTPAVLAVFPNLEFDPGNDIRGAFKALQLTGLADAQPQSCSAMDYLLPAVPVPKNRGNLSQASAFPVAGIGPRWDGVYGRQAGKTSLAWSSSRADHGIDDEEAESPVVPWLIHLVRTRQGRDRLSAASVLTCLSKTGFVGRSREPAIGALVIPTLVQLLDQTDATARAIDHSSVDDQTFKYWEILERTPVVLSRLVNDSERLQKAAFDANAVKLVSRLLKNAYEPMPDISILQPWTPSPGGSIPPQNLPAACRLGPPSPFPLAAHRVRMRESTLKAISSLAALRDEYRKAFVDQDALPYIVESLNHAPEKPAAAKDRGKPDKPLIGPGDVPFDAPYCANPSSVVVAACSTIRVLSRSPSILRTSLLDNGVAVPMYRLTRHPEIEVQIAATSTICNLLTEVSPMREPLTNEMGIMKVLCEHAHSLNPSLRLNAVWALKHFVQDVSNDLKKACLEELQPGWLVQLICDDTEDDAVFAAQQKLSSADNKRASHDLDEEMVMDGPSDSNHNAWRPAPAAAAEHAQPHFFSSLRSGDHNRLFRAISSRLAVLRENEINPIRRARADDLQIQEQGLDFIRNLISASSAACTTSTTTSVEGTTVVVSDDAGVNDATDMIDFLFAELGQDRLFSILAEKLVSRPRHAFSSSVASRNSRDGGSGRGGGRRRSRSRPSESPARLLLPQAKIIEAVIFILVHMAASVPRHRQLIIAQKELLAALLEQFAVRYKEVRLGLCHLVSNLTWQDDMLDAPGSRQRARELDKMGFTGALEVLEREEGGELDVKERAKGALWQMRQNQQF